MSISFVGEIGRDVAGAGQINITRDIPKDNFIVLVGTTAYNGSGAAGVIRGTDSRGGIYPVLASGGMASAAGYLFTKPRIFGARVPAALTSGDYLGASLGGGIPYDFLIAFEYSGVFGVLGAPTAGSGFYVQHPASVSSPSYIDNSYTDLHVADLNATRDEVLAVAAWGYQNQYTVPPHSSPTPGRSALSVSGWTSLLDREISHASGTAFDPPPYNNFYSYDRYVAGQVFHKITTRGTVAVPCSASPGCAFWDGCAVLLAWRSESPALSRGETRFDRRQLVAFVDAAGALKVQRYDDGLPPAVAGTVTVEPNGVSGLSAAYRRSGVYDLFYCLDGAVRYRTSRDQGKTFGGAVTIASGYQDVKHWFDEGQGLLAAALWGEDSQSWYITVGEMNAGGTGFTWSAPQLIASSAKRGADLSRGGDRIWRFSYVNTSDVATLLTCRQLKKDGTGTWS